MRIPRLYTPQPLSSGATVALDSNAFNHAVRVLRLKQGAPVILFNGEGGEYSATLTQVDRKTAAASLEEHRQRESESPLHTVLGQCISRGEKMDFTIQKAVELGINQIFPLFSERCGVKLQGERLEKKVEHWRSVVISACEQCGRNRLPQLHEPRPLEEWLESYSAPTRLILAPSAGTTLASLPAPEGELALLMGPEGGLSDDEIRQAEVCGFTGVRLGPRILRTETAALTALSAIQSLWGDLG